MFFSVLVNGGWQSPWSLVMKDLFRLHSCQEHTRWRWRGTVVTNIANTGASQ